LYFVQLRIAVSHFIVKPFAFFVHSFNVRTLHCSQQDLSAQQTSFRLTALTLIRDMR
jgi:hypothetical protein